jgi:hypothetical protein
MNSNTFMCFLLLMSTSGCATYSPFAGKPGAAVLSTPENRLGDLVVYSETYSPTLGQSEYSAHTNYSIANVDGHIIEHVTNTAGSFNSKPARVSLPAGEYRVRAQYIGGRFVTVSVIVEPDKTTIVDLDGEAIPQEKAVAREVVRLPDGRVVGWSATTSRSSIAS